MKGPLRAQRRAGIAASAAIPLQRRIVTAGTAATAPRIITVAAAHGSRGMAATSTSGRAYRNSVGAYVVEAGVDWLAVDSKTVGNIPRNQVDFATVPNGTELLVFRQARDPPARATRASEKIVLIACDKVGKRYVSPKDAVDRVGSHEVPDWPIAGPSTTIRLLNLTHSHGRSSEDFHVRWLPECWVDYNGLATKEYQVSRNLLDVASQCDDPAHIVWRVLKSLRGASRW